MIDPEVYTPLIDRQWLDDGESEATWARVTCPVLLLRGDPALGGMLPLGDADRMVAALADPTWVDIPGAGHQIHGLMPETFGRLVQGFLDSL
jgi:pimeloyl-ACP methyl ester carboxylesterase